MTALALCLAAVPAFAAHAAGASVNIAQSTPQTTTDASSSRIVVTVRKVYFFDQLDRNHNGLLSRAELPLDLRDLRRNFLRADFDHNGQISPMEYVLFTRGLAPQYAGVSHAYIYVYGRPHEYPRRISTEEM
ncbi:hypothetical protein BTJ49_11815 [Oleiagrimonas sp. MCCC 1A03011]|nr:hypothetical protein BTJ49_11815 [Oleiagrimonas sp. MCCC 1A03011]